ncbi:acyl-CoA carboxylase subunit epsilon, partial [Saccharomonospora halophila]|uniref:acyl-CoA carboxylase subunit epsilon n=1 Tax=Saccharomonospora halophila TaxID=129922 RepID=UPI002FBDAD8D
MDVEGRTAMADTDAPGPDTAEVPVLRIVRGNPDETEVAALTTVVAGLAAAGPAEAPHGG